MKEKIDSLIEVPRKYNFLWILYLLFITFVQAQVLIRFVLGTSRVSIFTLSDLILVPFYILSVYSFVFRKQLFTSKTWRIIFFVILLDLPLSIWRALYGDNPQNLQFNCQVLGTFCSFLIASTFLNAAVQSMAVYYALFRLSFPDRKLPFSMYPTVEIKHNIHPNRLWAVPLLGALVKAIILFPFLLFLLVIIIAAFFLRIVHYFHILFTGKIWQPALRFTLWTISLQIRAFAFFGGLTDTYPHFSEDMKDSLLSLEYHAPTKSNRLLGAPLIGPLLRYFIILPLSSYASIISSGAFMGLIVSWFAVLFTGKYPQSVYELIIDSMRLNASVHLYSTAMSDKYPSFAVSLKHPYKKALLILAILALSLIPMWIGRTFGNFPQ